MTCSKSCDAKTKLKKSRCCSTPFRKKVVDTKTNFEPTLSEIISDTTFYESSSSASESANENFNSVLIKKLNVNKGNAFGVKKNLSQFGEIEFLSVHYKRYKTK